MIPKLSELILKTSFTQSDAIKKLSLLKDYLSSKIFGTDLTEFKWSELILEGNQPWFTGLDPKYLEQINARNMETIFQDAENEIKQIPILTIIAAVELPDEEVSALAIYLRNSFGPRFLINLKLDPKLIAGAVLIWQGIEKDYSLRQKITQNRKQILGLLAQYKGG